MSKVKACAEFMCLAKEFLVMTRNWAPNSLVMVRHLFTKEEGAIESCLAVPATWEAKLERLERTARIVLKTKNQVTTTSYTIVKRNLPRATILQSKDGHSYLRLNNFLIKLL